MAARSVSSLLRSSLGPKGEEAHGSMSLRYYLILRLCLLLQEWTKCLSVLMAM